MSMLIFVAFIVLYALLSVAYNEGNRRVYKLFAFGLLVSVLWAAVYAFYQSIFPIFFVVLTSLAILTQYHHIRAVDAGRVEPTKMVINVGKKHDLAQGKTEEKKLKFNV